MTSLQSATALGQAGMSISLHAAERRQPEFRQIAERAILQHLSAVGQASGEDLTDIARAHGAIPADDRAFGGVFQSLSRRGLITCLRSDLPRRRGHGSSGGKLWGIDPCYFSSDEAQA